MVQFILPDWIGAPANIGACSTRRGGGVSLPPFDDGHGLGGLNLGARAGDDPHAVAQNRQRLRHILPAEPAWLQQVHGANVVDAALAQAADSVPLADASVTTQPGVICVVLTADCLPVLLCDRAGHVVGAVHAGWRGLAAGVVQNTIDAMRAQGAGDIMAWLGPAIGPAHFEVGDDVYAAFTDRDSGANAAFRKVPGKNGKYLADLYHLARSALASHGVSRIAGGQHCTMRESDYFYSFRRDQTTGRMASMIWLTSSPP